MYRYHREKEYFDFLQKETKKLDDPKVRRRLIEIDDEILKLHQRDYEAKTLFESLLIKDHKPIKKIIKSLNSNRLKDVKIYLTKDLHTIAGIVRFHRTLKRKEAIIQVSPKFFDFTENEQRIILAHEYMHYHHKHTSIEPYQDIKLMFEVAMIKIKSNYKIQDDKFTICKEISADIGALVLSDFDYESMQSAFIKVHFGVYEKGFEDIILKMYDNISKKFSSTQYINCAPHSLLRFKIIDQLKKSGINTYTSQEEQRINDLVDKHVGCLYPILTNKELNKYEKHFLLHAGLAIVLADGEITLSEIHILMKEFGEWSQKEKSELEKTKVSYFSRLAAGDEGLVEELLEKADQHKDLKKMDENLMYRYLLDIGHADGIFRVEEWEVVERCAKILELTPQQTKILYMFCGQPTDGD